MGFVLPSGLVLDSTPEHGVSVREFKEDPKDQFFRVKMASSKIIDVAMSQVGKPYDYRGALGFGLHRDWTNTDKWFCSELVAWACAQVGRPLIRSEHLNCVSPRDLLLSSQLVRYPT